MKYFIKYGFKNDIIDVTNYFYDNMINNKIFIFTDDNIRAKLLSDPCIYVTKNIYIFTSEGDLIILRDNDYAYIDLVTNIISINKH